MQIYALAFQSKPTGKTGVPKTQSVLFPLGLFWAIWQEAKILNVKM